MKRFILLATALLFTATTPGVVAATTDIPSTSLHSPELLTEKSISTHIPSESAPGQGVAVSLIYPEKPRYKDGAPVVVVVPAGTTSSGLDFSMHAAQAGFVEVRFAFPGGGKTGFQSSGIYDNRGQQSQIALKDVLLFAAGKAHDAQGRTISEIVPVKVYNNQVGVAAWSNGGNTFVVTLAKFAEELPFVRWAAFYETPMGALFFPANLGGPADLNLNPHYREGSAATGKPLVDYRKLAWQKDAQKTPGLHKKYGEPELRGVLFFDENKNGKWEEAFEYAFSYTTDVGLEKQIYPPEITAAAERLHVFDKARPPIKTKPKPVDPEKLKPKGFMARMLESKQKKSAAQIAKEEQLKEEEEAELLKKKEEHYWPPSVATLAESKAFFDDRDGSLYIKEITEKLPNLAVEIFASRVDHLQRQPDHPHITMQYNAWLSDKVKWVRLNPDPLYVGQMARMNPHNFIKNEPNESVDVSGIDVHLEPEGLLPDYIFMDAAIGELSDRTKANRFQALTAPIAAYEYGVPPPFDPNNFKTTAKPAPPKQQAAAPKKK